MQSDGRIESFDLALLDPHGGELQGYVLLRRSEDPIDAVRRDEHFERVMIKASLVVDDLGLIRAQSAKVVRASWRSTGSSSP